MQHSRRILKDLKYGRRVQDLTFDCVTMLSLISSESHLLKPDIIKRHILVRVDKIGLRFPLIRFKLIAIIS